jgi:hypothetical protein
MPIKGQSKKQKCNAASSLIALHATGVVQGVEMITRHIFEQIQEIGGFKISERIDEIKLFGFPIYTSYRELSRQAVSLTTEIKRLCNTLDSWECVYCGATQTKFHIDHIYPKVKGGGSSIANLATSCQPCNNKKGGHAPDEVGMKLQHGRYYEPPKERLEEVTTFFSNFQLCNDILVTREANKSGARIQELIAVRMAWELARKLETKTLEPCDLEPDAERFIEEARTIHRMLYLMDAKRVKCNHAPDAPCILKAI